jgi:hypothetical protein
MFCWSGSYAHRVNVNSLKLPGELIHTSLATIVYSTISDIRQRNGRDVVARLTSTWNTENVVTLGNYFEFVVAKYPILTFDTLRFDKASETKEKGEMIRCGHKRERRARDQLLGSRHGDQCHLRARVECCPRKHFPPQTSHLMDIVG